MLPWEAVLFRKGSGCPSCQGARPGTPESAYKHLRDRIIGGAWEDDVYPPGDIAPPRAPWVRPVPRVLATCAGCDVRVEVSPDDGAHTWEGGSRVHYDHGAAYAFGDLGPYSGRDYVADVDEGYVVGGAWYCPGCAGACACPGCSTVVFVRSDLDPGDPYADGAGFPTPGDPFAGSVCVSCYEELSLSDDDDADDDADDDDADDDADDDDADADDVAPDNDPVTGLYLYEGPDYARAGDLDPGHDLYIYVRE